MMRVLKNTWNCPGEAVVVESNLLQGFEMSDLCGDPTDQVGIVLQNQVFQI